jgi:hypothetical protein
MTQKWMMMGVCAVLTLAGAGCRVSCHFDKTFEVKGSLVDEECEAKIIDCTGGGRECRNKMRIECGEIEIYDGPYSVEVTGSNTKPKIKYIATDWDGEKDDRPEITTLIPNHDGDVVKAWERDNDTEGDGECRYDYNAN